MDVNKIDQDVKKKNDDGSFYKHGLLNCLAVAAQTCLETGHFKHYRDFNLAGIKCTRSWAEGRLPYSTRRCWRGKTIEYTGNKVTKIVAGFRSYDDLDSFFYDYSRLIFRYYPLAKRSHDCVWSYIAGLHGKWATDPIYFKKLVNMICVISPSILGKDWQAKLWGSLTVSIRRGDLAPWMINYVKSSLDN